MKVDIKIPAVGESITEGTIGSWQKKSGEFVKRNEVLLLLETDKASVEVAAEQEGVLNITVQAGNTVAIGSTVGTIDSDAKATVVSSAPTAPTATAAPTPSAPAPVSKSAPDMTLSPAVNRIVSEQGLNPQDIQGTGKGGRITKEDALNAKPTATAPTAPAKAPSAPTPMPTPARTKQGEVKRVPMTSIRKRIAERLLQSQQTTATLTTFNEIDMTKAMELRAKYKDKFKEKYGTNLGMMGIFTKACIEALKFVPEVNASIEGTDLVYKNYYNIGVAVGTDKGLIVPTIKDADQLTVAEIELSIKNYALKARDGKITLDDLNGGTFTISNGGVYGSLMSTPILNPPQSGILGMHKIEDRAVVVNGKVEVRPMMYVALSYDHRVIDGKEAVTFLVRVKECVEDPERILLEI